MFNYLENQIPNYWRKNLVKVLDHTNNTYYEYGANVIHLKKRIYAKYENATSSYPVTVSFLDTTKDTSSHLTQILTKQLNRDILIAKSD